MAYLPLAQEIGVNYELIGPNGITAQFNNPVDANYVGMLTEVTGLDSPEVRESADDLVEGDGGVHGYFYFGRRPITMTARIFGHTSMSNRATRIDRFRRASIAMRTDATLRWQPSTFSGGEWVMVPVRRQQPLRETGGWVKDVQCSLVSEFAVIMSYNLNTSASIASGASGNIENRGSYISYPILEITGVSSNPVVTVSSGAGGTFRTGPSGNTLTLAAGEKVEFDMLNHSGVFTAGARIGQSANRYIDFANITTWPGVRAATTESYALTGGGSLIVKWRDAWV